MVLYLKKKHLGSLICSNKLNNFITSDDWWNAAYAWRDSKRPVTHEISTWGEIHPRGKLPLSMRKLLQILTCFTQGEITSQGNSTCVLKTGAKFHPRATSVWFQRVKAIFVCTVLTNPENTFTLSLFYLFEFIYLKKTLKETKTEETFYLR